MGTPVSAHLFGVRGYACPRRWRLPKSPAAQKRPIFGGPISPQDHRGHSETPSPGSVKFSLLTTIIVKFLFPHLCRKTINSSVAWCILFWLLDMCCFCQLSVEKRVEVTKETPQITVKEIPVERVVEKLIQVDQQHIIEVPVEKVVERRIEVPKVTMQAVPVERKVEKVVQVPVVRIKEVPVEKLVKVDIEVPNGALQNQSETLCSSNTDNTSSFVGFSSFLSYLSGDGYMPVFSLGMSTNVIFPPPFVPAHQRYPLCRTLLPKSPFERCLAKW